MDTKKVSILTIVIIALTLAIFYFAKGGSNESLQDERVGDALISESDLNKVKKFLLKDDTGIVTIYKKNDDWLLESYYDIPVNFDRLNQMSRSLSDNRVERFVSSQKSTLQRLEMGSKSITLEGDGFQWTVQIGKEGKSGGQFIRLNDEDLAYLTTDNIEINTDNNSWAQKRLMNLLNENDIKKVTKKIKALEVISFERAGKEDNFTSEYTPEGMRIAQSEVKALIRELINLRFNETRELQDAEVISGLEHSNTYEIKTFEDNKSYIIKVGRKPEQIIAADANSVDSDTPEDVGAEDSESKEIKIPAGPVVIHIQYPNADSVWNAAQDKIAFIASPNTFSQLVNLGEKVFEKIQDQELRNSDE